MNIVIHILNIIDILIVYIIAVKENELPAVILWTVSSGLFFVLVWNKIVEKNESMKSLNFFTLAISIITLFVLLFILISKHNIDILSNCSAVIPMYISYIAMRIKIKKEGYDE